MKTSITAKKVLTLVLIHIKNEEKVLLGIKKRGFGAGYYNGFGGKLERNETVEQAAHRELLEEAGITTRQLERAGLIWFTFQDDPVGLEVHVFRTTSYQGEPTESDEMRPQWFAETEIPFDSMWPDDKYWFPHFLAGRLFLGIFRFSEDQKEILEFSLNEVDELPEGFKLDT